MIKEKWLLLQPTHHNGTIAAANMPWTNDPFLNLSKYLNAPLWNITDNVPLNYDIYWLCHFIIDDIEREIAFINQVKNRGAKVFLTFSHDMRFLNGDGLLSKNGLLWTKLCEVADGIGGGVSDKLKIFGRYQDKVISVGDVLANENCSLSYNERPIDLLTSGPSGEQFLSFGLETLLTIKERHPEKRIVCLVQLHHRELILKLQQQYPQIEFPVDGVVNLMQYMKNTKVYYNPELRPRPGRALIEAYYCRVPFISCSSTYFSKLCSEFSYDQMSIVDIACIYDKLISSDINNIIKNMEERASFDFIEPVCSRIKTKIGL
jgi:hypothetical protein